MAEPSAGIDGDVPVHRRTMVFEAFDRGGSLEIVGRIRDERPWAEGTDAVAEVHDMELRVTVEVDDLVITAASAHMGTFPHAECPVIEPAFAGLVGLSVARGYTREVQSRFGGPRGCTHLEQLARCLGPVVIQSVTSRRATSVQRGESPDLLTGTSSPWALDTCHIWAQDGPAVQKLAAGWRPGKGPYPPRPWSPSPGAVGRGLNPARRRAGRPGLGRRAAEPAFATEVQEEQGRGRPARTRCPATERPGGPSGGPPASRSSVRRSPVRNDSGRKMVAMMVSCFITTFRRFDTTDRCVSMVPLSRSR